MPLSIAGYSTDSQTFFKRSKSVPTDRDESIKKGDIKGLWILIIGKKSGVRHLQYREKDWVGLSCGVFGSTRKCLNSSPFTSSGTSIPL